eukprot:6063263-Pleurochrysis_carterae.AAC.1
MLPGLLLTPARQDGCERERAVPQVNASVHRSHRKGDEVCWRATLDVSGFSEGRSENLDLAPTRRSRE